MSRKKRTIAGFNEVANVNDEHETIDKENKSIKNNPNININVNEKNDDNMDPLDKVIAKNKKKEDTHILKGIYFEKEVAAAIDRIAKGGGKGIKSQLVNEAVKKVFKEKGWID